MNNTGQNIGQVSIHTGDCIEILKTLSPNSVQTCVTSPPYFGLRDYGVSGQLGMEETPEEYVAGMVRVFQEVKRVLREDGTLWLNIGDSYAANRTYQVPSTKGGAKHGPAQGVGGKGSKVPAGLKPKDLIGIPWRLAFALQGDGWYLRQDIIWHKPNVMPESVKDRPTKAHEYLFLLTKSPKYYFNSDAIKEPETMKPQQRLTPRSANSGTKFQGQPAHRRPAGGTGGGMRNSRSVWSVNTQPFKGAHFATMPEALAERCVLAGSAEGGVVLDPFFGSGTTGVVAARMARQCVGIELNPDYVKIALERLGLKVPLDVDSDAGDDPSPEDPGVLPFLSAPSAGSAVTAA